MKERPLPQPKIDFLNPVNNAKGWGNNSIVFSENGRGMKVFNIKKGKKTSYGFQSSTEVLYYVMSGQILLVHGDVKTGEEKTTVLNAGQSVRVKALVPHLLGGGQQQNLVVQVKFDKSRFCVVRTGDA